MFRFCLIWKALILRRFRCFISVGVMLMLGAGSVSTYLQTQRQEKLSDLTLANIEALAVEKETPSVRIPCCPAYWFNYCLFEMVMGDGTVANGRMDAAINC